MFERYTEKARRVIFFARYESGQFGSPEIEPEYLLLGIMRENLLLFRTAKGDQHLSVSRFRSQLEQRPSPRSAISTSVDLPLSNSSKRILAYAAGEAQQLGHRLIDTEHLLLGILREEHCFAAAFLKSEGVRAPAVRQEAERASTAAPGTASTTSSQPILASIANPLFTPESLHAIAFALEEAQALQQERIAPEHLLLGLLRLQTSGVPVFLAEHGIHAELLRLHALGQQPPPRQE